MREYAGSTMRRATFQSSQLNCRGGLGPERRPAARLGQCWRNPGPIIIDFSYLLQFGPQTWLSPGKPLECQSSCWEFEKLSGRTYTLVTRFSAPRLPRRLGPASHLAWPPAWTLVTMVINPARPKAYSPACQPVIRHY